MNLIGKKLLKIHYIYELAISKTMAQRQAEQLEQEKAKKTTKAHNTDNGVINLLKFRKETCICIIIVYNL